MGRRARPDAHDLIAEIIRRTNAANCSQVTFTNLPNRESCFNSPPPAFCGRPLPSCRRSAQALKSGFSGMPVTARLVGLPHRPTAR
jgi:hypothetical protein